jgi:hypothetical protein
MTRATIRTRMWTHALVLSLAAVLSSPPVAVAVAVAVPAQPDTAGTPLVITSVSAVNLTGDPTLVAAVGESLFTRLMSADAFFEEGGSAINGTVGGYFEHVNPFRVALSAGETAGVSVSLELEQVYYGVPPASHSDIAAFWGFGILSAFSWGGGHYVGLVQWRATFSGGGLADPIVLIGRGGCAGPPHQLGRREALLRANKRALYDITRDMWSDLTRRSALRMTRRRTSDNQRLNLMSEDIRRKVEDW